MVGSRIKPGLECLTSSAQDMGHAVVERTVERPADALGAPDTHVLVVHTGASATLSWHMDGTAHRARFHMGEALVNPAGHVSRPRWHDEVGLLLLSLDPQWLDAQARESGARPHGTLELAPDFHFTDPLLTLLVQRLAAEYEAPGPVNSLYAESLVQAAAAILLRRNTAGHGRGLGPGLGPDPRGSGLPARRMAELRDYIHVHLGRRITLDELSAVAGVSSAHLNRLFRASLGESPHQYVLRQRVERAQNALLHSDDSIADIAVAHGFADQSHLTRVLRRATGLTPGVLREDGAERGQSAG
ncbi:helix-turn-helix domain-containing protein [Streptomyces erythrochromogenes]|uniref:AraC family transcriptional regulator n=1 Tax=Streptomyces erythrochromogenes TaxID=285574 RepID=UPI00386DD25B|nr:AraC family transcriptional regulator [Streptomyces erythrochromogenes]